MTKEEIRARRLKAAQNRQKACAMRLAGSSYQEIGEALGVTRQSAFDMVEKVIDDTNKEARESVKRLKNMELMRLDYMLLKLREGIDRGDVQSITAALKIMERRAKYKGLDAPAKSKVVAKVDNVEGYDYGAAIAALAPRPVEDSEPSGEDQSFDDGPALGQDSHGG